MQPDISGLVLATLMIFRWDRERGGNFFLQFSSGRLHCKLYCKGLEVSGLIL